MLKRLIPLCLLAALSVQLVSCASPQERQRRDAERAKEDARYDAERRRRDREDDARDREDYHDFLADYARDLHKSVSELTSSERAEARREYDDRGYRHHYGYGYGFWGW